jgi:hypothetical protein
MYDFVLSYWCFAPYLGVLLILAVMSIWEGRTTGRARPKGARTGEARWDEVDGLPGAWSRWEHVHASRGVLESCEVGVKQEGPVS